MACVLIAGVGGGIYVKNIEGQERKGFIDNAKDELRLRYMVNCYIEDKKSYSFIYFEQEEMIDYCNEKFEKRLKRVGDDKYECEAISFELSNQATRMDDYSNEDYDKIDNFYEKRGCKTQ